MVTRELDGAAGDRVQLRIDRVEEERQTPDTERVKFIRVRSDLLSTFYGRDVFMEAAVILPEAYLAGDDTRYTRANGRVFARSRESYDFWVDNNLALIGSPETVARKIEESKERIGFTVFAASHHIGAMPVEKVDSSIRLFGEKVIPALS